MCRDAPSGGIGEIVIDGFIEWKRMDVFNNWEYL